MGRLSETLKQNLSEESKSKPANRFSAADDILNISNQAINIEAIKQKNNKINLSTKTINLTDNDNEVVNQILNKFMDLKIMINKSEILRMGLVALNLVDCNQLIEIYKTIDKLKTGKQK